MTRQAKEKVRRIQLVVPAETYEEFEKKCMEEEINTRAKFLELANQVITEFINTKKDFFAMSREETTAMYAEGIRAEVAKHHAAGRYTTHGDERGIYRLYPNGDKEYIDSIDQEKKCE